MELEATELARDEAIIEHIRLYGLSTRHVIHRLFFGTRHSNAVTKVLLRLREENLLIAYPLFDKQLYFVLRRSLDRGNADASRPYGVQKLASVYGVFAFCCIGETTHNLLSPEQWTAFKELRSITPRFPYCPFYLDNSDGVVRLHTIQVNHNAHPKYLFYTMRRRIHEWAHRGGFTDLVHDNLFGVTLVTANARKQQTIEAYYAKRPLKGIPLRIAVVPSLRHVLARKEEFGGTKPT